MSILERPHGPTLERLPSTYPAFRAFLQEQTHKGMRGVSETHVRNKMGKYVHSHDSIRFKNATTLVEIYIFQPDSPLQTYVSPEGFEARIDGIVSFPEYSIVLLHNGDEQNPHIVKVQRDQSGIKDNRYDLSQIVRMATLISRVHLPTPSPSEEVLVHEVQDFVASATPVVSAGPVDPYLTIRGIVKDDILRA